MSLMPLLVLFPPGCRRLCFHKRHLRKHTEENGYEFQRSQKRSLNKSTTFLWLHKCLIPNGLCACGGGYYERKLF